MEAKDLLHLTVKDPIKRIRCTIAMDNLLLYHEAAKQQINRIARGLVLRGQSRPKDGFPHCNIHFYFICWKAIRASVATLKAESGYDCFNIVYKQFKVQLDEYSAARDHIEHYMERLPGAPKHSILRLRHDLGNLHGNRYSLGGKSWDVSREGLTGLNRLVRGVVSGIRKDCIGRLLSRTSHRGSATVRRGER